MRLRPWEGLTIKAALVLGFGTTAALWLLAGINLSERVRNVQARAGSLDQRYIEAQEHLSTVRAQVLLGSVYVRDALLDPDPASVSRYRAQLEQAYSTANRSLGQYIPLDEAVEQPRIDALRRTIDEFMLTSREVLAGDRSRWFADARLLLRRDIGPMRDSAVQVSDEIQAINRTMFIQQQAELGTMYATSQRRIWVQLGLAFGGSLFIALVATMYVARLERDVTHRRAQEARTTHELQRLSARLVTAQEAERRTIARELHDEVGQVLMAIKVELAVAQRAIEASGGSRRLLDEAHQIADGALNTVRDLSRLLHPSLLDDLGLPAAIEWYVSGIAKRHGLRIDFVQESMEQRFAPEIEASAFRIVQEALTNVVKHAAASACVVSISRVGPRITLVVQDDGVGFDPDHAVRLDPGLRGLGLIGIRERASHLGGSAHVEAAPGRGTRLVIELPCAIGDGVPEGGEADAKELVGPEMIRG